MTVEATLFDALKTLVSDRIYPAGRVAEKAARPYITFQQVGGQPVNFLDPTVPSLKNGRFRMNVWANNRKDAAAMCRAVEDALRVNTTLQTTVLTAPVALFDDATNLAGTSQDFSFWF